MRRHLEGAEFDEAEAPHRAFRRVELVDADFGPVGIAGRVHQQVAEEAIDQPGLDGAARLRDLSQRDLEFVERFVPGFVDPRRLAGWPNELPGEHIG